MKTSRVTAVITATILLLYVTIKLVLFRKSLTAIQLDINFHEINILLDHSTEFYVTIRSSKLEASELGVIYLPNLSKITDPKTGKIVKTGITNGVCWFIAFIQSFLLLEIWEQIKIDILTVKAYYDSVSKSDKFIDSFLKFNSRYFNDEFKDDYSNLNANYLDFISSINSSIDQHVLDTGFDSNAMVAAFFYKLRRYINVNTINKLESLVSLSVRTGKVPLAIRNKSYIETDKEDDIKDDLKVGDSYFIESTNITMFSKSISFKDDKTLKNFTNKKLNDEIKEFFIKLYRSIYVKRLSDLVILKIQALKDEDESGFNTLLGNDEKIPWLQKHDFKDIETVKLDPDKNEIYELRSYSVCMARHIYTCVQNKNGQFVRTEKTYVKENEFEYCNETLIDGVHSFTLYYYKKQEI